MPWRTVKNRIAGLSVIESQIQDLRNLLAKDWQTRLAGDVAAVEYGRPLEPAHFDHPGTFFSAC